MNKSQTRHWIAAVAAAATGFALLATSPVWAQDEAEVDTSRWRCRNCVFDYGWSGSVTGGAAYAGENSFRFGDYTGFEEDGFYGIGAGDLRYRSENGDYLDLRADDLGLESRRARAEGGRQGLYRLYAEYDEIPHFLTDDTGTVFSGVGSENLQLPPGWVNAATTDQMTALQGNLREVEIEQDRETISVGGEWLLGRNWQISVDYDRRTEEGVKIQGGSFGFQTALLPSPVDQVTDEVEAAIAYLADRWQVRLAYFGSFFNNRDTSLAWENPFLPPAVGADRGRMALAPDNQFNQLQLSGSWRPLDTVQASGRVAYGRMIQDESFLPTTTNASLAVPGLPASNLDGRVDTLVANARVTARPIRRLRVRGELHYDERDNKSDRNAFAQVLGEAFVGDPRVNTPFSFERYGAELEADYRLMRELKLVAGGSWEAHERSFQEADETRNRAGWGEIQARPGNNLKLKLRYQREDRRVEGGHEPLDLVAPENPLLRKFNLADRERDQIRARADYSPVPQVSLGFSTDYADDQFEDTEIGLTDAEDLSVTADVSVTPWQHVTTYAYYSYQTIDSRIQGADNITGVEWTGRLEDRIQALGGGFQVNKVFDVVDLGLDYTYSQGIGDYEVAKRGGAPAFPNLETRLHSVRLFGTYHATDALSLRMDYWYEQFESESFFLDRVEPDTAPNLLSLGEESQDFTAHVIGLSARYRF